LQAPQRQWQWEPRQQEQRHRRPPSHESRREYLLSNLAWPRAQQAWKLPALVPVWQPLLEEPLPTQRPPVQVLQEFPLRALARWLQLSVLGSSPGYRLWKVSFRPFRLTSRAE
jgi:hypothetical protein